MLVSTKKDIIVTEKPVILAVDDEIINLESLKSVLRKEYTTHTAQGGKEALKMLRQMQKTSAKIIFKKLLELAKNPYAKNNNVKALQGVEGYRLRVGDWRVLYEIKDDELVIVVIKVRPRGGAYGI